MAELIDNCTLTLTTRGGTMGDLIIGPNGNSIFLPAAGYREESYFDLGGSYGEYWYWSSSFAVGMDSPIFAMGVEFGTEDSGSEYAQRDFFSRYTGFSVHPVYSE